MLRQEALEQYQKALKLGQKCRRSDVVQGNYPYPRVLEEFLDEAMTAGRVDVGRVEIPTEQIIGTVTSGRKSTFASNFMPLLPQESEFASKWINLCMAHLGDEGIRDPIVCVEYMGNFYVQEGNKRVSVLKSYDADTIPGYVTRIVPSWSQAPEVQEYYAFLQFYRLTELYQVRFTQAGDYAKLQAALGFDPEHVWTQEERKMFLARFSRFRDVFVKGGGQQLGVTVSDALLVWLRVYTMRELWQMTAAELKDSLKTVWPDIALLDEEAPLAIQTEPEAGEKGFRELLSLNKISHLNVAFLFHASPSVSAFTRSHELGAEHVAQTMAEEITVRKYYDVRADESGEWVMEKAVAEGAQVLIATAPPLIGACRKIAARHPELKVLNCALSMPYTGVRTYYSRVYEGKFITGAVAAAMAGENTLGYVANYPIYGVPAGINAFALGARMVNPNAKVQVEWSCLEKGPYEEFERAGVKIITNQEVPSPDSTHWKKDWGTYLFDGTEAIPLVSPCWDWGKFYEKMLRNILSGGWNAAVGKDSKKAVGYWWGLDSGVIDVQFSDELPDGVKRLGKLLRRAIINGTLDPFRFVMYDQSGSLRSDGESWLSPEEIMKMDWLCDNVIGHIPSFEEIKPISQNLVRVLGVYREQIPPQKEGVLL